MRIIIVGAGPTGLVAALGLARRGHAVSVVDRDPGPRPGGSWRRRGVMQFHHSHGYRGQVVDALRAEAPEVLGELLAAGAALMPVPGRAHLTAALQCRRALFDRLLWSEAVARRGIDVVTGTVEGVVTERGRAAGVRVDGHVLTGDLVLDASGRSGRTLAGLRGPAEGADCGVRYVDREYALLPGADPGPVNSPIGMSVGYPRYMAIVFRHDGPNFSVLIACAAEDRGLRPLARPEVFEAALRAIPHLAAWTDPARARPTRPVRAGAGLRNSYRGQLDAAGRVPLPGLIAVGDAVCTTTPLAGRGVALSLLQVRELLRLLDEHGADAEAVALELDDYGAAHIRPWFDDHVHGDADRVRRWSGGDVDTARRLPSELIVAAAEADPALRAVTGPYEGMLALPACLARRCRTARPSALRRGLAPHGAPGPGPRRARRPVPPPSRDVISARGLRDDISNREMRDVISNREMRDVGGVRGSTQHCSSGRGR